MPTSTSRLSLLQPVGTDAPSEYRLAITGNANTLDAAVIVTEGTLSARPMTGLVVGQSYYATDTGLWYFYTGSAWETVMLAGAWTPFGLATNWDPWSGGGSYVPAWRIVGDKVELRGAMQNNTGGIDSIFLAANLPAAARPASFVSLNATDINFNKTVAVQFDHSGGAGAFEFTETGAIEAAPNGAVVCLDGLSYSLS